MQGPRAKPQRVSSRRCARLLLQVPAIIAVLDGACPPQPSLRRSCRSPCEGSRKAGPGTPRLCQHQTTARKPHAPLARWPQHPRVLEQGGHAVRVRG